MIAQHYQGNTWWIMCGLFSLFLISQILWGAWQRHKVGMPVDVAAVVGLSGCLLVFIAMAIYEVFTHRW
jgi:hypothetical protein